jgi:hypothetical protein
MSLPAGWQNPIAVPPGQIQKAVDARLLLPSRGDLVQLRLDFQRSLRQTGVQRFTSIQVTIRGVIWVDTTRCELPLNLAKLLMSSSSTQSSLHPG